MRLLPAHVYRHWRPDAITAINVGTVAASAGVLASIAFASRRYLLYPVLSTAYRGARAVVLCLRNARLTDLQLTVLPAAALVTAVRKFVAPHAVNRSHGYAVLGAVLLEGGLAFWLPPDLAYPRALAACAAFSVANAAALAVCVSSSASAIASLAITGAVAVARHVSPPARGGYDALVRRCSPPPLDRFREFVPTTMRRAAKLFVTSAVAVGSALALRYMWKPRAGVNSAVAVANALALAGTVGGALSANRRRGRPGGRAGSYGRNGRSIAERLRHRCWDGYTHGWHDAADEGWARPRRRRW